MSNGKLWLFCFADFLWFTFKTCLGSSVFSLESYLGKCFLDLLVRFPGLVPLQSLDLSFANGIWFACLLSNYCCALLTIWQFQTICTACWLKIRQPSPFRQLSHNWVSQGWSAHLNTAPSLSSILLFNTLYFNTLQYFEQSSKFVIYPLQYFELQYFSILFNTLQYFEHSSKFVIYPLL